MRGFISYAHADDHWYQEFHKWMARLRHDGVLSFWSDHALRPGELWDQRIRGELDAADVVFFLVSQNFERSEYIHHVEVTRAIVSARSSGKLLIPILCEVSTAALGPLGDFQATPSSGAPPVSRAPDYEQAWKQVLADVVDACDRHHRLLDLLLVNQRMRADPMLAHLPALFPGAAQRPLATLYVELHVAPRVAATASSRRLIADPSGTLAGRQERSEQHRKALNLSIEQALASDNAGRFVISGDPGSGKSSLLRRVALEVAAGNGAWRRWDCAFLIELRRLIRRKGVDERWNRELFLRLALEPWMANTATADRAAKLWAQGLIGSGRPLLLFDGLDEIAGNRDTHEEICELISRLPPSIDWIVTSRLTGLFGNLAEQRRYEIAPLDDTGVEALVTNWFEGSAGASGTAIAGSIGGVLVRELMANDRLLEMARNPFLLSAICFLREASPAQRLPMTRAGVYRELLDQIARHAQLHYNDRSILDLPARQALERFAHWTYEQPAWQPIHLFSLAHWQAFQVEAKTSVDLEQRVLPARLLVQESELADDYHFIHLSLHEYLVARACLNERVADVIRLRHRPQWRPIIIFYGALLVEVGRVEDFKRLALAMAEPPDLTHRMLIEVAQLFHEADVSETRGYLDYDLVDRLWDVFCSAEQHTARAAIEALWRTSWARIEHRTLALIEETKKRAHVLPASTDRLEVRHRFRPNPYMLLAGRRDGVSEAQLSAWFLEEPSNDIAAVMVEAVALALTHPGRLQIMRAAADADHEHLPTRYLLLFEESPHPDFLPLVDTWMQRLDLEDDEASLYARLGAILGEMTGDAAVPILERETLRCLRSTHRLTRTVRVPEFAHHLSKRASKLRFETLVRIEAEARSVDADLADTVASLRQKLAPLTSADLQSSLADHGHPFDLQRFLETVVEAQQGGLLVSAEFVTAVSERLSARGQLLDKAQPALPECWGAILAIDTARMEAGGEPALLAPVLSAIETLVAMDHPALDPDDPDAAWYQTDLPGLPLIDEGLPVGDPRELFTVLASYAAAAGSAKTLDLLLVVARAPMTVWGRASRYTALCEISVLADKGAIADEVARQALLEALSDILCDAHAADELDLAEAAAWAIGCVDLAALMGMRDTLDVSAALTRFSSERNYLIYESYYVTPIGEVVEVGRRESNVFVVMSIEGDVPLVETFLSHLHTWGFGQSVEAAAETVGGVIIAPAPSAMADLDRPLLDELSAQAIAKPNWPVLLISTSHDHARQIASQLPFPVTIQVVAEGSATANHLALIRAIVEPWRTRRTDP